MKGPKQGSCVSSPGKQLLLSKCELVEFQGDIFAVMFVIANWEKCPRRGKS